MEYGEFEEITRNTFPGIGEDKLIRFRMLGPLYRDWNSKINVISRQDLDSLYIHHVLHSLAIAEYMRLNMPETYDALSAPAENGGYKAEILDLGTGGGFPGIPLAILFPGARFTLCDSIGKKTRVAEAVAEAIGLTNVTVINARAEDIDGQFDYIVSRAVTSLDRFLPWVRGKYDKGILYLKGGDIVEEISTAMGRFRIPGSAIHTWRIDSWIQDPYFAEKSVIFIDHQIRNNH